MKLVFDPNQDYQWQAVLAVADLFKGQPGADQGVAAYEQNSHTSLALTETGIANRRVLSDEQLLANLQEVQARHLLPPSPALANEASPLADLCSHTGAA